MAAERSPLYLPAGERPALADDDVIVVVLVVNGSLGMSTGKTAAQTFQAAVALGEVAGERPELVCQVEAWKAQGCRTVVRQAETAGVFERLLAEADGVVLHDEGLTEVPDGAATVFCSFPHRRGETPKILSHKRIPLL